MPLALLALHAPQLTDPPRRCSAEALKSTGKKDKSNRATSNSEQAEPSKDPAKVG